MSKWIELETDASTGKPYLWKCDECGEEVETRWNYCPECGDPKTSKGKNINTLVKALETEHKKLREMQSATDKNVGTNDTISRQAAIDALNEYFVRIGKLKRRGLNKGEKAIRLDTVGAINSLPPAQPEPCEDAVSRKAVKDGFVEMCSLICPYTEKQRHAMCGSCLLGTAFDVLEATQSVTPKQRWIPVIERLPEKQTKVLVVDFGEVDTAYLNSEGRWRDFHGNKLKDVKAWMPLPKWEGDAE